jgi:hypothetical protein
MYDNPFALYPYRLNDRLIAQKGYFTILGNITESIDDIVPDSIHRIPIPKEAQEDAKMFLRLTGVNEYTINTDLNSLSNVIQKEYFPKMNTR